MSQKLKRREKGTGTIYQDKSGIWRGKLRYTPAPHAKQIIVNFRGESEADVRKQIREYNKSGQEPEPRKADSLVLYAERWLHTFKYPNMKASSYDKLEATWKNHVKPCLGMLQLKQVTAEDVQKLLNQKKAEGYSHSMVKKVYNFLTALFDFAIANKDLMFNPMLLVKMPEARLFPTKKIKIFAEEEIEKIIAEARRTYSNGKPVYMNGEGIVLMLETGIRMGELLGLKKTDHNPNKNSIHIQRNVQSVKVRDEKGIVTGGVMIAINSPKTSSSNRHLPCNGKATEAIEKLCITHPDSKWLVCTKKGDLIPPDRFLRTFYTILKNAGIEKVGTHSLRHTFASKLFAAGIDIKTISRLLGHNSVQITYDTYIHLIEELDHDAVAVLDDL